MGKVNHLALTVLVGLLALLAGACEDAGSSPAQQTLSSTSPSTSRSIPSTKPSSLRGLLLLGQGSMTLYDCTTNEPTVILDPEQLLTQRMSKDSLTGTIFFAELQVSTPSDTEVAALLQITSLDPNWAQAPCEMIQHVQALGNEPGWELRVDPPNDLLLRTNYGADEARFPYVLPKVSGNLWTYDVTIGMGEGAQRLQVAIRGEPCGDKMSGNSFTYQANVTWNGQVLSGCARPLSEAPKRRN